MPDRKTVLIVDDNTINRKILGRILSDEYDILQAGNGREALEILNGSGYPIACVLLDIVMPVMNGYEFLAAIRQKSEFHDLPVIVITSSNDQDSEKKALQSGAWDFVSKPYNTEIVIFRIHNAIERSQIAAFQQIKYMAEFDSLTGIYNREKFYDITHVMLQKHNAKNYIFCRMDINRFQLINSYFGIPEGNRLLKYLADMLRRFETGHQPCAYGRIEADVFAMCWAYEAEDEIQTALEWFQANIKKYNISYDILLSFGLYRVEDCCMAVDIMLDRANMATKSIKGNYMTTYAYYTDQMGRAIEKEQEITNDMNAALDGHQFYIQIQPKYDLRSSLPMGGETLVRWNHPQKGRISPGDFIPVFEKNGFISKLDFYVWNETCICLRRWLDEGYSPHPVSVNVSRVNLYNPRIVDVFCELVKKYGIPPELLQLELTESAYTDNPHVTQQVVRALRSKGFTILMDDFGSGYSSLNILKDIEVDILKIDTKFLTETKVPGRGENIIASVVRMAKWLNIPVVAEGAEKKEQVEFLRGIGCEYVQGFYFSRPLDIDDYIKVDSSNEAHSEEKRDEFDADSIWTSNPQMELLFSNAMQASAVYEYDGLTHNVECIRVNNAYYDMIGYNAAGASDTDVLTTVLSEYRDTFLGAIQQAVDKRNIAECEYMCHAADGSSIWVNLKVKYVSSLGDKHILFGSLFDITAQKEIESELNKYRTAIAENNAISNCMLVVDDEEINRAIVHSIFEERFTVLEAANGQEALELLKKCNYRVDIIMLDMLMPVMDGTEFLRQRRDIKELADIPVIIITADETAQQQINTLAMGANDYIIKPFVEDIMVRRVNNVLESRHRFRSMLHEYQNAMNMAKADPLTHVYNRAAAEDLITHMLESSDGGVNALLMIDIDNYKLVNDTYDHDYGDMVLTEFAASMARIFRKTDVIARMGGDEFCVLMRNAGGSEAAMRKAMQLCSETGAMSISDENIQITCSIGVTVFDSGVPFEQLYRQADIAMYESKRAGKNRATLYEAGKHVQNYLRSKRDSVDSGHIRDGVCISDYDTDELVYANGAACGLFGSETWKGQKCYEFMAGRTAQCTDCFKKDLSSEYFTDMVLSRGTKPERKLIIQSRIIFDGCHKRIFTLIRSLADAENGLPPQPGNKALRMLNG